MPVRPDRGTETEQAGSDARLLLHLQQAGYGAGARLGIAVSGGSDSLALLYLAQELAQRLGWVLFAATVDHGLRAESAAEARAVADVCTGFGIAHEVLLWQHGAIDGNLQDRARRARYGLLATWGQRIGVDAVLIAHTADDQAETFLMGLARAAGLDGLSGMRAAWVEAGMRFHRPLLTCSRAELRGYLSGRGGVWVDDPSNDNDRFTRVKARQALRALAPLGITADRLAETVDHLAKAQQGQRVALAQVWGLIGREEAGALYFSLPELAAWGEEIERRLLLAVIAHIGTEVYAPREAKLANLRSALHEGRDATLAGCRFRLRAGEVAVFREPNAVKTSVCAPSQIWDGRWQMQGPEAPEQEIRALGAEGLRQLEGWRAGGIPRDALLVSPAIWCHDALIAAPLAGFAQGWQAKLLRNLNECILSH